MDRLLRVQRHVYVAAYEEYLRADRDWLVGLERVGALVPDAMGRGFWTLGNPGSKVRRSYQRRDRALQKLMAARSKLENAKLRLHSDRTRTPNCIRLLMAT